MTTKAQRVDNLLRYYMQKTGETDVDMTKLAAFAVKMGWPLPKPRTPMELLAREFSRAARETIRHDPATKRPYRAYHAYTEGHGDAQRTLWIDIDKRPTRKKMHKSLTQRREQMVGDAVQLAFDAEHWNNSNPSGVVVGCHYAQGRTNFKTPPHLAELCTLHRRRVCACRGVDKDSPESVAAYLARAEVSHGC